MNRCTGLENLPVLLPFLCESNSLQITQSIMCILFVAIFLLKVEPLHCGLRPAYAIQQGD